MARKPRTAGAAALSLLPLVALMQTSSGREIVMLGPQYLGAEAGIQWNDVRWVPPMPCWCWVPPLRCWVGLQTMLVLLCR